MEHLDKVKMILQNDFAIVPCVWAGYFSKGVAVWKLLHL